jgi:hypothetical protein
LIIKPERKERDMKNTLRSLLMTGVIALCAAAGLSSAKADVIRVAVVTADSQADYDNNAALVPGFAALLKKSAKAVYAGTDASHMAITTTSVWASEADLAALTGSAEWKAMAEKLKAKSYTIGVFQLTP